MANKLTGEVAIGKYKLVFDMNTFCDLQSVWGLENVNDVMAAFNGLGDNPDFVRIRQIFRAALVEYHGDISEREAGKIATEIGLDGSLEKMAEGLGEAFGGAEDRAEAGDDENPPKPPRSSTGSKRGAKRDSSRTSSGSKRPAS